MEVGRISPRIDEFHWHFSHPSTVWLHGLHGCMGGVPSLLASCIDRNWAPWADAAAAALIGGLQKFNGISDLVSLLHPSLRTDRITCYPTTGVR